MDSCWTHVDRKRAEGGLDATAGKISWQPDTIAQKAISGITRKPRNGRGGTGEKEIIEFSSSSSTDSMFRISSFLEVALINGFGAKWCPLLIPASV